MPQFCRATSLIQAEISLTEVWCLTTRYTASLLSTSLKHMPLTSRLSSIGCQHKARSGSLGS